MEWRPIAPGVWESDGYRIAAFKIPSGWIYALFEPEISETEFEQQTKIKYQPGEFVPQRRRLIGHYTQPDRARAAAEQHRSEHAQHVQRL